MTRFAGVNLFAADVIALTRFYGELLAFREVEGWRNPGFRALTDGHVLLGVNAREARATLGLEAPPAGEGVRVLVSFAVDSRAEVERLAERAVEGGARIVRDAHESYFGAWQAVLLDPEGNAFRLICMPGQADA